VFVLGATNRPEMLDPAIMRPGRLDAMIKVPLPDEAGRADIMRSAFARWPLPPAAPMDALTAATEGMSGADVVEVCRSAASAVIKVSRKTLNHPSTHLRCRNRIGFRTMHPSYICMFAVGS
jgi:transitional endoplasmic reticulum ATPase